MNDNIRTIYLDYKLFVMEIEDSEEIYKTVLMYISSNNQKYDKEEIIVSLKSITETFSNIIDYQKTIENLLKDNELIPSYYLLIVSYYLLIVLIINNITDKIWILLEILKSQKTEHKSITKVENIFNLTNHLLKNMKYILSCVEVEYYKNEKEEPSI